MTTAQERLKSYIIDQATYETLETALSAKIDEIIQVQHRDLTYDDQDNITSQLLKEHHDIQILRNDQDAYDSYKQWIKQTCLKANLTESYITEITNAHLKLEIIDMVKKSPSNERNARTILAKLQEKYPHVSSIQQGGAQCEKATSIIQNTLETPPSQHKDQTIEGLKDYILETTFIKVIDDNAEILIWKGTHFEGKESKQSQTMIIEAILESVDIGMTTGIVKEVINKLKRTKRLFISRDKLDQNKGIAFRNGFYNFTTKQLEQHHTDNLNRVYLNADYTACTQSKNDLDGLEYSLEDIRIALQHKDGTDSLYYTSLHTSLENFESFYTWLEALAYSMDMRTDMQKIIMNLGPGANGKSVFMTHWQTILGNYASESIHDLATNRFRTANLHGKLINVYADIEYTELKVGTGIIKALTDGSMISAERKQQDAFQFSNFATLFFSANTLPVSYDQTDGWFRRFVIIHWNHQFTETDRIIALDEQLIADHATNSKLFGLLMEIRARLYARGKFRFEQSISDTRKAWNESSNPLERFMAHRVITTDLETDIIPKRELYNKYIDFCGLNNVKPISYYKFNQHVREQFDESSKRIEGTAPIRVWLNMKLKNPQTTL